jgi:hypothetical protein
MSDKKNRGSSWAAALVVGLGGSGAHGLLLLPSLFLLLVTVPNFEALFADMGATLPVLTQLTLSLSGLLRSWWFLCLPVGLLGLALDAALLVLLARVKGWVWSLLLATLSALPLVVLIPAWLVTLYLPIFSMAQVIQ